MRITIKHLEYFVAAGQAGSIKRAAEQINISQPSISSAIAHLERELNVQLFVRHHAQGISLTTTGKTMMREAKLLLRQFSSLYSIAAEQNNEIRGDISIGCMTTLAPMIIPELSQSFIQENPNVRLHISEGSHQTLLSRLRQVKIDIAIFYDLQVPDGIVFTPLASLPPQILLPAGHPLSHATQIRLKELEHEPMVLLDLPYSRQYFLSLFEKQNLTPNIAECVSTIDVSRSLVANGFGYTIVNGRPINLTSLDGKKLVSIPVSQDPKPAIIGMATLAQDRKPKILQAFEDHCCKLISSKSIPGMELAGQ